MEAKAQLRRNRDQVDMKYIVLVRPIPCDYCMFPRDMEQEKSFLMGSMIQMDRLCCSMSLVWQKKTHQYNSILQHIDRSVMSKLSHHNSTRECMSCIDQLTEDHLYFQTSRLGSDIGMQIEYWPDSSIPVDK